MLAGIFVSIFFWSRVARRDERLVLIYVAALVSAQDVLAVRGHGDALGFALRLS